MLRMMSPTEVSDEKADQVIAFTQVCLVTPLDTETRSSTPRREPPPEGRSAPAQLMQKPGAENAALR